MAKRILVTGAAGQIGSELVPFLRNIYGNDNVVACGHNKPLPVEIVNTGPSDYVDVRNVAEFAEKIKKYDINMVYHLAAILSASGEKNPQLAWDININGLYNVLEVAREYHYGIFIPSSIAAFGPNTPKVNTPQDTIQRPTSMYGITKVAGELLADYYWKKYGVDARGVRYPGIISYVTPPGGGTTDYAVEIFYEAILHKRYTCFLKHDTMLDMMYMPDALKASVQLMEADPYKLKHRNAFNVTSFSINPSMLAEEIKKYIPEFVIDYEIDPVRQGIADSWPDSMDDSCARQEWGWKPDYDFPAMVKDMIEKLSAKLLKDK
ncbi:MAG TPA: L-threonine 3-dehydrogenase [Candidatus Hydrothermia bacterium]|nr:L-threonine 3-dehydrogenase [Candidatus Hydrothermae bacterium]MDD3648695.1 L-threonine 3-dehydrogenase [Candidatus Hydrothermia bacterium]MDD5572789.1 L-threonine 3-dehydrogenase [Candidatus Hydrothermia bacterium]HOK22445.1 L-threonine 3-dehydrogenase [Candidatus Hydrothermia bacterium]HOL23152.1 L-threonine 3-dehydrogenase [Candidatus Hydrothermia bacterium]